MLRWYGRDIERQEWLRQFLAGSGDLSHSRAQAGVHKEVHSFVGGRMGDVSSGRCEIPPPVSVSLAGGDLLVVVVDGRTGMSWERWLADSCGVREQRRRMIFDVFWGCKALDV